MKKIISLTLAVLMLMSVSSAVYADETNFLMETSTYTSHVAHLENINEQGTNLHDETVDGSSKTIPNTNASIAILADNTLTVTTNVDGTPVVFSGVPAGRTESGKSVFFTGTSSSSDYEVVDFTYVSDISVTNMYFKTTQNTNYSDTDTMLKLYVKDLSSETRDYYFIEVFDVELNYSNEYIQSLEINPLLGAWEPTQFKPIEESLGIDPNAPSVCATDDIKYWYCTKTFYAAAQYQTHTIRWYTEVDYSDVTEGQEENQYFILYVTEEQMTFSVNTELNNYTTSVLSVVGIKLRLGTVPYTAWRSTTVDGEVFRSIFSGDLTVGLGISHGILSASYSIPVSFPISQTMDLNGPFNIIDNNSDENEFARNILIDMDEDSNFSLTEVGHYFAVVAALRDYGNAPRSAQTIMASWDITIGNSIDTTQTLYGAQQNGSVAIVD